MSALQRLRRLRFRFRPQLFLPSRWKYTRLPSSTDISIIRLKPLSILRYVLRSAGHGLKFILLQAKYLVPLEAQAVQVWIM
ncbi:uncharacterized protein DNG_02810 [Cephalotrichum gorgonifer]|uniref:Uncharacterized protein n=1 Tax=Cephalotrichum gorgonifer TaxID=2041049 RepID=A0AAE8MU78_9PEZI|nr:uncharacterized protein DNG_02810 [Cephalotrichum gorgonifer]